jgi:hypothetical protein
MRKFFYYLNYTHYFQRKTFRGKQPAEISAHLLLLVTLEKSVTA